MMLPEYLRRVLRAAYQVAARLLGGTRISQVFPFNVADQIIRSWMRTRTVVLDGHVIHLDSRDCMNLSVCGAHEPFEACLLQKVVQPGFVVVDVGANIGYYTLLFARAVGSRGIVHAFEPEPSNVALLERNVLTNQYTNVVINRSAVSDVNGSIRLYLAKDNAVDHRLSDLSGTREGVEIAAVRLDHYFANLGRAPDLVKMDIQGAEGRVIETLGPLIRRNPRLVLIIEFWPYGLVEDGTDPEQVLAALVRLGFQLEELDERKAEMRTVTPSELLARYTQENRRHTNLLCRPTLSAE